MEIKRLPLGPIEANCYLISTEKAAVVIDPGFYSQEVIDFLNQNSSKERLILLTHGHFDHVAFANQLRDLSNTKIAIGLDDNQYLNNHNLNLSAQFGMPLAPFTADILLNDGDELSVGDINFKAIHTPGHTVGGFCFLVENYLFSGDTLFNMSIGRTDFPLGNYKVLENSVKKLYQLSPQITVLSGHGPETTLGFEKSHNPYIRG